MLTASNAVLRQRTKTGAKLSATFTHQYNGLLAVLQRDVFLHACRFSYEERWKLDYALRKLTDFVNGKPQVLTCLPEIEALFDLTLYGKYRLTGDYPDADELVKVVLFRDWLFLTLENL